ncbi:MAG: SDR family NAD(P)-dependent oxidoreductase, partial [Acidobacteria bacterium]|nr:SDR family NAD(P)-dependent oxidoreductase [Acidobacteriota bacterium]
MAQLANKVALITGAGSGMGRATATVFAKEGAKVVVVDINESAARETAERITAAGGEAICVTADVSKGQDAQRMIEAALDNYKRIDVLHNNAGVFLIKFLEDTSEEEWDHLMGINLKSIFWAVKFAV